MIVREPAVLTTTPLPIQPSMRGSRKFITTSHTLKGLDRLELIRFLQVAQTISAHQGALAYLWHQRPARI